MSDQISGKQNLNPTTNNEDLGRGLTGLSSAWPLHVGEQPSSEQQPPQNPRAAAS